MAILCKRYRAECETGVVVMYQRIDDSWVVEVEECGETRVVFTGPEDGARREYAVQKRLLG